MSPARLRPEWRIPWYAAVIVYAVTYVTWAGLNGWDFTPTPFWIVVAIVLGSLYGSRAWLVKEIRHDEAEAAAARPAQHEADTGEHSTDDEPRGATGTGADL